MNLVIASSTPYEEDLLLPFPEEDFSQYDLTDEQATRLAMGDELDQQQQQLEQDALVFVGDELEPLAEAEAAAGGRTREDEGLGFEGGAKDSC